MNREQRRDYERAFGREPQCERCGTTWGPDLRDFVTPDGRLAVVCEDCYA